MYEMTPGWLAKERGVPKLHMWHAMQELRINAKRMCRPTVRSPRRRPSHLLHQQAEGAYSTSSSWRGRAST